LGGGNWDGVGMGWDEVMMISGTVVINVHHAYIIKREQDNEKRVFSE
jgi:hypothetical protein